MGNRVQLDTIRCDLPGRRAYVCIGQWYPPLGEQEQGRHRHRSILGRQPTRGAFSPTTNASTSRSLVPNNPKDRDRTHGNDSREVVRTTSQSIQSPPGQNLQALITSLEQIELRLQRTEEQSDIRDADTK